MNVGLGNSISIKNKGGGGKPARAQAPSCGSGGEGRRCKGPSPQASPALPSGRQRLRLTESDKLQVQIQAYLDNVFDVGVLLEDTETKNAVLEHMEELQEQVALVSAAPDLGPEPSGPTQGPTPASGIGHRA